MIRPLLTPRKITGNATIGLVSAARNSVRNIKRSTDTISNAPGVTKEQKFGMNYVGFFGSKRNSKILDKSLKTIRDSMVSTFGIATALKVAVKTGQGIFGFIGKIFKFAGSILNLLPFSGIIKTFLVSIAVGGVGGLFFKFKDQILGFFERSEIASKIFDAIKSKAKGFTSYIKDIISDFLISRKMSGEFQQLRTISQQRLNEKISDLGGDQDAVVQANKDEIKLLEQELKLYKEQNKDLGLGDEYKNQVKAYQDRITELKTGAVPARQKLLPFAIPNLFPFNNFGLGDLQKVPAALNPVGALTENLTAERGVYTDRSYDKKSTADKLLAIQDLLKVLGDREGVEKRKNILMRDLDSGGLQEFEKRQANDMIKYLDMLSSEQDSSGTLNPSSIEKFNKYLNSVPIKPIPREKNIQNFNDRRQFRGGGNFGGGGTNISVLPMGNNSTQPDLIRNDTGGLTSGPSMRLYANVDHDNFVALINKSSLNVV